MAFCPVLGLYIIKFDIKLLLGDQSFLDHQLDSGIYLDGIGKQKFFE
jgi:hypothetical protein